MLKSLLKLTLFLAFLVVLLSGIDFTTFAFGDDATEVEGPKPAPPDTINVDSLGNLTKPKHEFQ